MSSLLLRIESLKVKAASTTSFPFCISLGDAQMALVPWCRMPPCPSSITTIITIYIIILLLDWATVNLRRQARVGCRSPFHHVPSRLCDLDFLSRSSFLFPVNIYLPNYITDVIM